VIAWSVIAAAGWAAYELFWADDNLWPGIALVAGVVALVWVAFAVALGAGAATPGKAALGLRAVHFGTGTPIGVDRALLRGLVLGVATIPTFGIGLATLAWTAVMDPGHRRRGWHDQVARSIVVDVRPTPVAAVEAESGPRHVVNLTAMRLVPPASPPPVPAAPRRTPPLPPTSPAPRPPTSDADGIPEQAPLQPVTPTPVGVPEQRRTGCWRSTPASGSLSTGWCWWADGRRAVPARPCVTSWRCRRRTCRCRRRTPRSASPETGPWL
jgi:uncharacterized RDD family membrane protein YckC